MQDLTQYRIWGDALDIFPGSHSFIEETPEENNGDGDHKTKENGQCKSDRRIRECFPKIFWEFNDFTVRQIGYFNDLCFSSFLQEIGIYLAVQVKLPFNTDEFPLPLGEFVDFGIEIVGLVVKRDVRRRRVSERLDSHDVKVARPRLQLRPATVTKQMYLRRAFHDSLIVTVTGLGKRAQYSKLSAAGRQDRLTGAVSSSYERVRFRYSRMWPEPVTIHL